MIGEYLEQYNFTRLISSALDRVPDSIDKREGSVIYDALAPACYELAGAYMRLRELLNDTYAQTANGEYLELRALEQDVTRLQATKAIKKAVFLDTSGIPISITLGSRFSIVSTTQNLIYKVISQFEEDEAPVAGTYILECEELGSIGNDYIGELIPIDYIQGLGSVEMTTLVVPARDIETDEGLRERYFSAIREKPFGGNIRQYKDELLKMDGIGAVQIYPAWQGGGSVLCSIISPQFEAVSPEFLDIVKEALDPSDYDGDGLGLAPIGHRVTVVTPTIKNISITAKVTKDAGVSNQEAGERADKALQNYFRELREEWGRPDVKNKHKVSILRARISYILLEVLGITNVQEIGINGEKEDLELVETKELQELPVLTGVFFYD